MPTRLLLLLYLLHITTHNSANASPDSSHHEPRPPSEIDELIMESPTHIDELWKSAVKEYSRQIQHKEGGLGAICSKTEHCTDPTKKGQALGHVCGKNGRCKPNATDVDDACRWGLHTCMHKENSAIRHFAEQEVRDRLGQLDKDEDSRSTMLQTALLPAPAQIMMALPAPPSMNNESTEADLHTISTIQGGGITVAQAAYVDSLALVDEVSQGALTSSGALPLDTSKWLGLAKEGKNIDVCVVVVVTYTRYSSRQI